MANPKPNLSGSTRININGNTGWLLGANLPWTKCGGDFGGNSWGSYGIGSPDAPPPFPPSPPDPLSSQALSTAFQAMQAAGVKVPFAVVQIGRRAVHTARWIKNIG
jgi:hypothetical protein